MCGGVRMVSFTFDFFTGFRMVAFGFTATTNVAHGFVQKPVICEACNDGRLRGGRWFV